MTTLFPLAFAEAPGAHAILSMHAVDFLIIAIYFVVVLAIGIYLRRYAKSGEDFFMAGREMYRLGGRVKLHLCQSGRAGADGMGGVRVPVWNSRRALLLVWGDSRPCSFWASS